MKDCTRRHFETWHSFLSIRILVPAIILTNVVILRLMETTRWNTGELWSSKEWQNGPEGITHKLNKIPFRDLSVTGNTVHVFIMLRILIRECLCSFFFLLEYSDVVIDLVEKGFAKKKKKSYEGLPLHVNKFFFW